LFTVFTSDLNLFVQREAWMFPELFIFFYKHLSWHENKIDAANIFANSN